MTAEATGATTPVAIGTATATDAVGIASITSNAPASFPVGLTVVTWTAADTAGNTGTATQNVTVQDTTAPCRWQRPRPTYTAEATGTTTTLAIGTATATDAVGIASIASNAPAAFPVGPHGGDLDGDRYCRQHRHCHTKRNGSRHHRTP